jgi:hypothetical protein
MLTAPREHRTTSSFALRTVTFPTVGPLPSGRMIAEAMRNANALEFAVEKVAVPLVSVAAGVSASVLHVARLEPDNSNRAAFVRTCTFPSCSVSSLSPANTVVPTDAAAVPTRARSADTTMATPGFAGAFHAGVAVKLKVIIAVKPRRAISRNRAIASPEGLSHEYTDARLCRQ